MGNNVIENIWQFNNLDIQTHFLIFFFSVSGFAFLTFRLLWILKAQVSGDESENDNSFPVLRLSLRTGAFILYLFLKV